jgi:hypothetical protein
VYRLAPGNGTWTENILHHFGSPGDGSKTLVGVILDGAGKLFGTMPFGLSYDGNIFELTPTSALTWNAAHTSLFRSHDRNRIRDCTVVGIWKEAGS